MRTFEHMAHVYALAHCIFVCFAQLGPFLTAMTFHSIRV